MRPLPLLALCALLAACHRPDTGGPPPSTATAPQAQQRPESAGPASADAGPTCSAAGLKPLPPQGRPNSPKLPPAVASMRERILGAAVRCDYEALARLTRGNRGGFKYSFGDGEDPATYWRRLEEAGDPILARIVRVLNLPYSGKAYPTLGTYYTWPSAYGEQRTDADWAALEGLYPHEEIESWRRAGQGYLGLRVGIHESGEWRFAVAGD